MQFTSLQLRYTDCTSERTGNLVCIILVHFVRSVQIKTVAFKPTANFDLVRISCRYMLYTSCTKNSEQNESHQQIDNR